MPSEFELADERFLDNNLTKPYFVDVGTITVTDDIKNVRNILDAFDLNNNEDPVNFADGATISANVITLDPVQGKMYWTLPHSGSIQRVNLTGSEIETVITIYLSKSAYANGNCFKYDSVNDVWQDYSDR